VQRCHNETGTLSCEAEQLLHKGDKGALPDLYHIVFGDVMTFGALLEMANVSLNDAETRMEGLDLVVNVIYHNTNSYSLWPGETRYLYTVSRMPGKQSAKVERVTFYNEFKEHTELSKADRLIINQHGVFIKVVVTGKIGWLDRDQALVVLASSLTLFASVRIAMDFISTQKIFPGLFREAKTTEEYSGMKFDNSRDFNVKKKEIEQEVDELIGDAEGRYWDKERLVQEKDGSWVLSPGYRTKEEVKDKFSNMVMLGDAQAMEILANLVWEHHHEHKLEHEERKSRVVKSVAKRGTTSDEPTKTEDAGTPLMPRNGSSA
jgi:hypothetical protein